MSNIRLCIYSVFTPWLDHKLNSEIPASSQIFLTLWSRSRRSAFKCVASLISIAILGWYSASVITKSRLRNNSLRYLLVLDDRYGTKKPRRARDSKPALRRDTVRLRHCGRAQSQSKARRLLEGFESGTMIPKQKSTPNGVLFCFGAPSGIRTRDPLIKSQLLYQLS